MPYRKVGTLEACWTIIKLWALELLGLNKDEEVSERDRERTETQYRESGQKLGRAERS